MRGARLYVAIFFGIVALIIAGLIQFDQIMATIYVFIGRASLDRIVSSPLPEGLWHIALFNIIINGLFLALIPLKLKGSWKYHSPFVAFMISMFSEMYGFPLTIYFLSGFFGTTPLVPQYVGYVWTFGHILGSTISIIGMILVYLGWREIIAARQEWLVTTGIYNYVRHPQYLGLILITFGYLVVWPTITSAILWPIIIALYYRAARREERELLNRFGEEFLQYARRTPMFIPRLNLSSRQNST
ncbi:MAG: isoprenylcysteine carboxylmethyltransferase family protein [Thaumarchaeota archaeon]|nr:isoprenylcysteine carboxylmethyltransferase family protein [Candidatus Calditenuaceae archaeon]MDW8187362.1 isoprenylcysteine carboxylmethyltransferase family protein [Nitrososphaerota archaeon]